MMYGKRKSNLVSLLLIAIAAGATFVCFGPWSNQLLSSYSLSFDNEFSTLGIVANSKLTETSRSSEDVEPETLKDWSYTTFKTAKHNRNRFYRNTSFAKKTASHSFGKYRRNFHSRNFGYKSYFSSFSFREYRRNLRVASRREFRRANRVANRRANRVVNRTANRIANRYFNRFGFVSTTRVRGNSSFRNLTMITSGFKSPFKSVFVRTFVFFRVQPRFVRNFVARQFKPFQHQPQFTPYDPRPPAGDPGNKHVDRPQHQPHVPHKTFDPPVRRVVVVVKKVVIVKPVIIVQSPTHPNCI